MKDTLRGLVPPSGAASSGSSPAFIFLYYFSPGLSTPLYYHMTDELKFSQAYIGVLGSIAAGRLDRRRAVIPVAVSAI